MKKIISLALAFMLAGAFAAFAEGTAALELDYNTQNNSVRIYGSLGSEFENLPVSLLVVKGRWETESSSIKAAIEGKTPDSLNWYDLQIAGENGGYDFTYDMTGESGADYSVLITVPESDTINCKSFTFFDSAEPSNLMERYMAAVESEDYGDIENIISQRKDYLQLDMSVYDALPDAAARANVAKSLLACSISTSSSADFITDFKNEFVKTCKVWSLNTSDTDYSAKLAETIGDAAPASTDYLNEFSADDRADIINTMQQTDYETMDELMADYNKLVLTHVANNATVWGELHTLVTTAQDELGIDLTDYNKLSDKSAAMKLMLKETYTTLESIKDAFEDAVDERKSKESKGSSGGGSGGGGGSSSGGGGGAVFVPQPVLPSADSGTGTGVAEGLRDINDAPWATESIAKLHERGVISGDENGYFLPNKVVSRAEFTKMLVAALGYELIYDGSGFEDVNYHAWYAAYVYTAREHGIVNGVTDTLFAPDSQITRQDAVLMLYRAATAQGAQFIKEPLPFEDSGDVAEYAGEAVESFYAEGYISGMGNNRLEPVSVTTKAQAAKMLHSLFEGKELWGE